jgi:type I restriction enzyme, S subunit
MAENSSCEWIDYSIDEIKADSKGAIAIGPFGSRMKSDCYVEFGIPVIRGNNISATKELIGDFVYISDELADELSICKCIRGGSIFSS